MRKSQRSVLSCTECARRKTRCSKSIPCSSCVDRGKAHDCHRETVAVVRKRDPPIVSASITSSIPESQGPLSTKSQSNNQSSPSSASQAVPTPYSAAGGVRTDHELLGRSNSPVIVPTNETVVTLEFLTHGRNNILTLHNASNQTADSVDSPDVADLFSEGSTTNVAAPSWDTVLSAQEARLLLKYHQENIAWMHDVVHMPTFKQEFESNLTQSTCDRSWIALYYAILCVGTITRPPFNQELIKRQTTLYHVHEDDFIKLGIDITGACPRLCDTPLELTSWSSECQLCPRALR